MVGASFVEAAGAADWTANAAIVEVWFVAAAEATGMVSGIATAVAVSFVETGGALTAVTAVSFVGIVSAAGVVSACVRLVAVTLIVA